jgi:predicted GNAT family acetyltransferase
MEFIHDKERIYANNEEGEMICEITFPEVEPDLYDIDHTFVDDSLRGQGIAGKLMDMAVEQIRDMGGNIRATCSYAVTWLEKHPQEDMSVEAPNGLSCRIDR